KLADKIKCNINLIEYNPHSGCKFVASSKETIRGFAKILTAAGIETTIRLKMGHKIKAACGQLGATLLNRNSGKQKKSNQN
ncbi:MAG: 23S rRNA (adenine(2503)-C(2))-methyltransferase RlmN, partial [Planctomycetes bacterium]|nr:23S rRNA (adenine(2503)-C(2))-methyltransferase RlmN [Planctomycetota bacterium]